MGFFRRLLDEIFHTAGLTLNVAYEPLTKLGILGLVANGLGVSIYAEGLKRFQPQRVMFKPIADCSTSIETILFWNRANQSPALRNFVAVVSAERNGKVKAERASMAGRVAG